MWSRWLSVCCIREEERKRDTHAWRGRLLLRLVVVVAVSVSSVAVALVVRVHLSNGDVV